MKNLMLLSTHTGVGKHTITCGILWSLRRQGIQASPFKAVSIETHTCRLPDGAEISFAQALQAAAAGKVPCAEMNPYVAVYGEQFVLIELGKRLAKRPHMVRDRAHYLAIIEQALQTVANQAQLLVIEGAGSPVELGLENVDLANIPVARMADVNILLLTEMLHGGGYASIVGTWELLPEDIRARIVGIVLNKFDIKEPAEFAHQGIEHLSKRLNQPVMTIPFLYDTYIPGDATLFPTEYAKFGDYRSEFDQLADVIEARLDMSYLKRVLGISSNEFDA
jgi:adenosylcobyric acid synthase